MLKKTKVAAIAILASIILATTPAMLLAQGQIQTVPAQQIVTLAERAAQQIQNLIDMINANEDALAQIDTVGLTDEFDANVTLYEIDGLKNLADAQEALTNSKYEDAVDSAVEALSIFREVYSSIHTIMKAADLQKDDLIENQGLLEAITREQQRIDRLREILPVDAPQDIFDNLDTTSGLLSEAKTLLLDGDVDAAKAMFLEAKENISEVYDYLKEQAVDSNTWRLSNYCEQTQERIRERFRYGQDQGVDFTSVLQSYGYQTESQFLEALQNRAQTAQGEQNFDIALQDCEAVSQMVQQMEQSLNQEIGRHQAQNGPGGSDSSGSGSGSNGSGSGKGGNGSGYGGSGGGP
jgi:hypothetical protein